MWRLAAYWFALSVVVAAGWSLLVGVEKAMARDFDRPENDDQVREHMERMRDAGAEIGL